MTFSFTGQASPKKIDVKRGESDEANVVINIKFHAEDFPAAAVAAALGADDAGVVDAAFFRPLSQDADRNTKFLGLKWIQCETTWKARHAIAVNGLRKLRVDSVGAVLVKPRANGRFDARFSVTITNPPDNYIELLAERINRPTKVTLEQEAELPLEGGQNGRIPDPVGKQRAAARRALDNLSARNKASRKPGKKAKRKAA